nr:hypothetical protein HK105_007170 [Polyrhizophydium stewartii]
MRAAIGSRADQHIQLGGDLNNGVVHALFSNFASMGYSTIRFNFRGVGLSTGRTTFRGIGEIDDVVAVYKYVTTQASALASKVILCGYSYGSVATCAAACELPLVVGLISISYPAGVLWALTLGNQRKHLAGLHSTPASVLKMFISGAKDNFTSESAFTKFADGVTGPKTVVVVPEADHFWAGIEKGLAAHINQWFVREMRPHLGERGSFNELAVDAKSARKSAEALRTMGSPESAVALGSCSSSRTTTAASRGASPARPSASTGNLLAGEAEMPPRVDPGSASSTPVLASAAVAGSSPGVKGPRQVPTAAGSGPKAS